MSELISRFRAEYSHTKKSLGQHFLTNKQFVAEIAESTVSELNLPTVEIGPGCGVLTEELAKRTDKLTVIDLDDVAVEFLRNHKQEFFPDIDIIHSDVMKVDLASLYSGKICIAGNLPYNVSVRILEHCTRYVDILHVMVFMFQKEVATRIASKPGVKDYSSLSVFAGYYFDIKKVRDISGANFWPNANVMSTVLTFTPRAERTLPKDDEEGFFEMVRAAFKQKRKTLYNNLKDYGDIAAVLEKLGFSATIRAEQISIEDFIKIYELIKL